MVERMRLIKDDWELAALRRGGRALADVASRLGSWVREGRTERELARDIDQAIERAGFERPAFHDHRRVGPEQRLSACASDRSALWHVATWSCWTSAGC